MLWQVKRGNKSVGTHPEGNSWWAKAGGPKWAICGRPFVGGQLVGHLWWAKSGGPIRSKPGGPTGGPIGGPFAVGQNWWANWEPSLVAHSEH